MALGHTCGIGQSHIGQRPQRLDELAMIGGALGAPVQAVVQPEGQQQRQRKQAAQGKHGAEIAAMQFRVDDAAHEILGSCRRALMIPQMISSVTANPHH